MPIHYDARKGRWRFQFRRVIGGRPVRASRLLPAGWNRAKAEAYDRAETARLYAVAAGLEQHESPLIEPAVQAYLEAKSDLASIRHTASELAAFLDYYEGRRFEDLASIAQAYQRDMRGVLAPATVRNRLAYLRAACNWAWKHAGMGSGESPPGARMAMPSVHNRREVYLTVDQVLAVAASCPPDTAALVRLAFFCGLRWISELVPRTQEDIVKLGTDTWLVIGKTKNGRPVMKPVHPQVVGDLAHLPVQRNPRAMYDEYKAALAAHGLGHATMHDLRHSLASVIISEGGTLSDVQGALHHDSVQSSARYAHLYPQRLRDVLFRVGKTKGKG